MEVPFGFVVIDKPSGLTSHDCVSRLRKIFGIKRVGHGGTLDPNVTGVLPIAIGNATRLLPYLPGAKTYIGVIHLGKETLTDDLQGEVVTTSPLPRINHDYLEKYLSEFQGKLQQKPPHYSSVHVKGKRSYELAREGVFADLPDKSVTIYELRLLRWSPELGELEVYVHCSAGTYIRSIARDLGKLIGCGGCMGTLRRIQALGFIESQAIPLPSWEEHNIQHIPKILPAEKALSHLPRIRLTEEEVLRWKNGASLTVNRDRFESPSAANNEKQDFNTTKVVISHLGCVAGIANFEGFSTLKPKVVFNANGSG